MCVCVSGCEMNPHIERNSLCGASGCVFAMYAHSEMYDHQYTHFQTLAHTRRNISTFGMCDLLPAVVRAQPTISTMFTHMFEDTHITALNAARCQTGVPCLQRTVQLVAPANNVCIAAHSAADLNVSACQNIRCMSCTGSYAHRFASLNA